jgi:hypothetical protein
MSYHIKWIVLKTVHLLGHSADDGIHFEVVWHDPQGAHEDYAIGHVIGAMLRGIFGGSACAIFKWLWSITRTT